MMATASWMMQTSVISKHMRVLLMTVGVCGNLIIPMHSIVWKNMPMIWQDCWIISALAYVAGISYGSEVSLMFALRYPEKTQSLIVIDGVSEVTPLLKSQSQPWRVAAERNDPKLLFLTSVHLNFSETWIEKNAAYLDGSVAAFAKIDMPAFVRLMDSFTNFNVTDRLGEIACPTLIVVGDADLIKGPKYASLLRSGSQIQNMLSSQAGMPSAWKTC